jgi:hypothetical protein
MKNEKLPKIEGKYNEWCMKRDLVNQGAKETLSIIFKMHKLKESTRLEKLMLLFHEITQSNGFEFVGISNAKIESPIIFENGIILVPCFNMGRDGEKIDALMARSWEMAQNGRFIYDGWIPVKIWDVNNLKTIIETIDQTFALLSLSGSIFFEWKPKYIPAAADLKGTEQCTTNYSINAQNITELCKFQQRINNLSEKDRNAVYRSIGWLSQSYRLIDPAAKFLFVILAIESLANYIEDQTTNASPLFRLKSNPSLTKKEIEGCIEDILSNFPEDKTESIKKAYFDCVIGITRKLANNFESVFGEIDKSIKNPFRKKKGESSLYDIRSAIAHGRIDNISDQKRNEIYKQIDGIEILAQRYIRNALKIALNSSTFLPSEIGNHMAGKDPIFVKQTTKPPFHMAFKYV